MKVLNKVPNGLNLENGTYFAASYNHFEPEVFQEVTSLKNILRIYAMQGH